MHRSVELLDPEVGDALQVAGLVACLRACSCELSDPLGSGPAAQFLGWSPVAQVVSGPTSFPNWELERDARHQTLDTLREQTHHTRSYLRVTGRTQAVPPAAAREQGLFQLHAARVHVL